MRNRIRFLCDENVRQDVVDFLVDRGHEVMVSRDVLAMSAPDQLIALLGSLEALVVISHDSHFKNFRNLLPQHERSRFKSGAGRLQLAVPNERSPQRVLEEIESIEHHYEQAQKRRKRFDMVIQPATIRVRTM